MPRRSATLGSTSWNSPKIRSSSRGVKRAYTPMSVLR